MSARQVPLLPAPRLLWAVAALALLALAAALLPALGAAWPYAAAAFAAVVLADAAAGLRQAVPEVARGVPASLALGVRTEVRLRAVNHGARALRVELNDLHPASFECEGLPQRLALAPGEWRELRYQARPLARGEVDFGQTALRLDSPLGLWQAQRRAGAPGRARVFPNFRALARYTLLATDHRLSQIGVLQVRRRGEGMEFHQLREYRQGDSQRAIDWKATARTAKLIAREYEDERDQRVLLVIDCGRRMGAKDDALSHFDHALNAALLLAHVALRQGDAVGVLAIGTQGAPRYVAPRKSVAAVNAILERVYDLEPTLAMPDFEQAAREVMARMRRRALVVMLTNLRDEDDETLLPALALLRKRHLVVLASLREAILGRALAARVDSFDRAVTHAAAAGYLAQRERAFGRIGAAGALCFDVEPEMLAISLVNRYLELKRQGQL
ncbi:MAG: DUF58 domain-containing protein [Betaproteobacteria bacterium]|nr:DUF58 domain-containing protein [Betaproteobacteria bacterium]MDH5222553.1 DUF58 domain-containing protein [Betaproteobacteria bacterium]MDH5351203.1 DUF58 domain-containing protein [Betaproteobacteria bacterium]